MELIGSARQPPPLVGIRRSLWTTRGRVPSSWSRKRANSMISRFTLAMQDLSDQAMILLRRTTVAPAYVSVCTKYSCPFINIQTFRQADFDFPDEPRMMKLAGVSLAPLSDCYSSGYKLMELSGSDVTFSDCVTACLVRSS